MFRITLAPLRRTPLSLTPFSRSLSSTPLLRSAAGYGDDPTELPNNQGTKTPASAPNPTPHGEDKKVGTVSGSTDPEMSSASKAEKGRKGEKAVGQGVDAQAEKVMGEGKDQKGAPGEKKKVGEAPEKQ